jgi:hypothetical protein
VPRFAWIACLIVACGYPPLDGGGNTDGGVTMHGGDGSQSSCDGKASYSAAPTDQSAEFNNHDNALYYLGRLDSQQDDLEIALGIGGSTFPSEIDPGTYSVNFSSCDVCVVVAVACTGCTIDNDVEPATYYQAMSGSITLNDTGNGNAAPFGATLTNATFVHVTLDANANPTKINDGCTTMISSMALYSTTTVE